MGNRFPILTHGATATISDVARVARVSKGTVSKYLSNTPYVAESTRRRIEAAIEELDYQPSALAQGLSRRRSFTVGVVVASLRNPFYPELIAGVEDATNALGYTLLLATTDADPEREAKIFRSMQQRRVDGMIVAAVRSSDTEVRRLVEAGSSIVLAGRGLAQELGVDTVVLDNREGAMLAVRHLMQHGHTRIAHLAGPQDVVPLRHRLDGYRAALSSSGQECDETFVVTTSSEGIDANAAAALTALMASERKPTAVFAANDHLAMALLGLCREKGWNVPRDLALVGFDDVWVDSLTAVPLTSVSGRAADIGREAARLLVSRIERSFDESPDPGPAVEAEHVVLQPFLVARQSCGCP